MKSFGISSHKSLGGHTQWRTLILKSRQGSSAPLGMESWLSAEPDWSAVGSAKNIQPKKKAQKHPWACALTRDKVQIFLAGAQREQFWPIICNDQPRRLTYKTSLETSQLSRTLIGNSPTKALLPGYKKLTASVEYYLTRQRCLFVYAAESHFNCVKVC